MASCPIIPWQIEGEKRKIVTDFLCLGSDITTDGDCSHEIRRWSLLGRKAMTNLDSVLKSRGIILPTKVCVVKGMVFPVVTCGCESWTLKKAECQRIEAFQLRCWRRLLNVPWTARKWNQSLLREITPEYWLEGLMLKLKLQYFSHLKRNRQLIGKVPDAGENLCNECSLFTVHLHWVLDIHLGFSDSTSGKESTCSAGDRCIFCPWVGKILWRRKWQPAPVFWPGKFLGQRRLMGHSPWDCRVGHAWAHT